MTEVISKEIIQKSGWTTRDIIVTSMISIALGVIYIPLSYMISWLENFPFISGLTDGFYYWPIIMVAYLIRKPGVALYSAIVTSLMQVLFTPWGIMMLVGGLNMGIPIEVVLLARRYKNFELWYLMLTGAICALFGGVYYYIKNGLGNISPLLQMVYFIEVIIGGAVLGGLLAKWIGEAVLKTGVISN